MKFSYKIGFSLQSNLKDLDPSHKTDLDLWVWFKGRKPPSENYRYGIPSLLANMSTYNDEKEISLNAEQICNNDDKFSNTKHPYKNNLPAHRQSGDQSYARLGKGNNSSDSYQQ